MTGEQGRGVESRGGRAPHPLPSQENLIASPVLPSQGACAAVRMLGCRCGFPVHAEHEGVSTGRLPEGSAGVPELRQDGGERGDRR